jgi:hypothetical protein
MREPDLEVMLHGPEVGEADFLGAHHLVHHIVKGLVLALAMLERAVYLDLVEDSKVHHCPSLEPGHSPGREFRQLVMFTPR